MAKKQHVRTVYLAKDIAEAYQAYKEAGHLINLSLTVQMVLVDKFIQIEKGRRLTGDPFLFTPSQLASMKLKLEERDE